MMQEPSTLSSREAAVESRISIIIPTYNRGHLIEESIRSALEQEVPAYEIFVVDDGSEDDTKTVINPLLAKGVRYLAKKHSGTPDTRNAGILNAKGDFLLWLDSDDVLISSTIARYLEVLRSNPEADVLYGNLIACTENLRQKRVIQYEDWHGRNSQLLGELVFRNPLPNGGTLVRKQCYERVGLYNVSFSRAEDLEWWSRAAKALCFKHSGASVLRWRQARNNQPSADDFIFTARAVKELLKGYTLKELFPQIAWESLPTEQAEGEAYLFFAMRLKQLRDIEGALEFIKKSIQKFPSHQALAVLQSFEHQG
jgi:glycosyltransferase involved in cell wall biosynthesis